MDIDAVYSKYARHRNPLPSEAEVDALERRLNTRFPEDHRRFLLSYNGGHFEDAPFATQRHPQFRDRLTFLNGIRAAHPSEEVGSEGDITLFEENDPLEILPIGYTIMGNLLFIVLHPEDFGNIGLKLCDSEDSLYLGDSVQEFLQAIE